jgi:hypothetical protein
MRGILDLDPFPTTSRAVAAITTLGDDAFQAHDALPEDHSAVDVLDVFAQSDVGFGVGQLRARVRPRLRAAGPSSHRKPNSLDRVAWIHKGRHRRCKKNNAPVGVHWDDFPISNVVGCKDKRLLDLPVVQASA